MLCPSRTLALAVVLIGSAPVLGVQARETEDQFFERAEALNLDRFGGAIAMTGNVAVIGATGVDTGAANAGAAYVYRRIAGVWTFEQKLVASDAVSSAQFGAAVAASGDRLLIGAPTDSEGGSGAGAAYVWRHDGNQWVEESKLIASDASNGAAFGEAVALQGTLACIGSDKRERGFDDLVGAVYVWRHDGVAWNETQIIAGDNERDYFGTAVALDGPRLLVGIPGHNGGSVDRGRAAVYLDSGGSFGLEQTLFASDQDDSDQFGISVDLSGTVAVVGAFQREAGGTMRGGVYSFRRSGTTWSEEQILLGHDTGDFDRFGVKLSLDGPRLAVHAPLDDEAGTNSGAVFLFRHVGSQWVEQAKVVGSDSGNSDSFGEGLVVSGSRMMAGSPSRKGSRGVVYAFQFEELSLDVQPDLLAASDPVDLWIGGGTPGKPFALFTMEFSGAPFRVKLLLAPLGPDGRFHASTTFPDIPALVGQTLSLQTFALDHDGKIAQSKPELLEFQ